MRFKMPHFPPVFSVFRNCARPFMKCLKKPKKHQKTNKQKQKNQKSFNTLFPTSTKDIAITNIDRFQVILEMCFV